MESSRSADAIPEANPSRNAAAAFIYLDHYGRFTHSCGNARLAKETKDRPFWLQLPSPLECNSLCVVIPAFALIRFSATLFTDCVHIVKNSELFNEQTNGLDNKCSISEIRLSDELRMDEVISIPIERPGSFQFYIEYSLPEKPLTRLKSQIIPFVVAPNITINEIPIQPTELIIETMVPQYMGTVKNWWKWFEYVASKGFNCIHLLPVMRRGKVSSSPYCTAVFNEVEPSLFDDQSLSKEHRISQLEVFVQKVERELKMLTIGDVNLSHIAADSPWIEDHPNAVISLKNTPSLKAAYELDMSLAAKFNDNIATASIIQQHTDDEPISEKREPSNNLIDEKDYLELSEIQSSSLNIEKMIDSVLRETRLWEYYSIKEQEWKTRILKHAKELKIRRELLGSSIDKKSVSEKISYVIALALDSELKGRFERKINVPLFASVTEAMHSEIQRNRKITIDDAVDDILSKLQHNFLKQYEQDVRILKSNLIPRIKERLRQGQLPLLDSYFITYRMNRNQDIKASQNQLMTILKDGYDPRGKELCDTIFQARSLVRRTIVPFNDCARLNFGDAGANNDILQILREAIEINARIFHGFRFDFAHGTPLNILKFAAKSARKIRPNILLLAEYLGPSDKICQLYQELGLDAVFGAIAYFCSNQDSLYGIFNANSRAFTGCVDKEKLETICQQYKARDDSQPVNLGCIKMVISDICHDVQEPFKYRYPADILATMALISFSNGPKSSLLGYDEAIERYPHLISDIAYEYPSKIIQSPLTEIRNMLNCFNLEIQNRMNFSNLEHHGPLVLIHRFNIYEKRGFLLIARTAFHSSSMIDGGKFSKKLWHCHGRILKTLSLSFRNEISELLLPCSVFPVNQVEPILNIEDDGICITIEDQNFPAGSICILETWEANVTSHLNQLTASLSALETSLERKATETESIMSDRSSYSVSRLDFSQWTQLLTDMRTNASSLSSEQNHLLLYVTHREEDAIFNGISGTYYIEGWGNLRFAGFAGWKEPVLEAMQTSDSQHPLMTHLQRGNWASLYIKRRLKLITKKKLWAYPRSGGIFSRLSSCNNSESGLMMESDSEDSLASNLIHNRQGEKFFDSLGKLVQILEHQTPISHAHLFCEVVLEVCATLEAESVSQLCKFVQMSPMTTRSLSLWSVAYYSFLPGNFSLWRQFDVLDCWKGLLLLTGQFAEAVKALRAALEDMNGLNDQTLFSSLGYRFSEWALAAFQFSMLCPEDMDIWSQQISNRQAQNLLRSDSSTGYIQTAIGTINFSDLVGNVLRRLAFEIDSLESTDFPHMPFYTCWLKLSKLYYARLCEKQPQKNMFFLKVIEKFCEKNIQGMSAIASINDLVESADTIPGIIGVENTKRLSLYHSVLMSECANETEVISQKDLQLVKLTKALLRLSSSRPSNEGAFDFKRQIAKSFSLLSERMNNQRFDRSVKVRLVNCYLNRLAKSVLAMLL